MTMTTSQEKAIETAKQYIDRANELYNMDLPSIPISFKLKGRVAGKFIRNLVKQSSEIRYNKVLLEENEDDFLKRTVPHEIAHYVAYTMNSFCKSHGYEWKKIMRDFECDVKRCHSYDTTNSRQHRKQQRKYAYKCACMEHHISSIKHKRIQTGTIYRCNKCKNIIEIKGLILTLPEICDSLVNK